MLSPFTKFKSKSCKPNDLWVLNISLKLFFLILFFKFCLIKYFSKALESILFSTFPFAAISPSKSKSYEVFFLIHSSIKQLPGPISNASIFFFESSSFLIVFVILDIPPIFKKLGHSLLFSL